MPAIAAMDNETLDHLLSVTDLALATLDKPVLSMFYMSGSSNGCRNVARQGPPRVTLRPRLRVAAASHIAPCWAQAKSGKYDPQARIDTGSVRLKASCAFH